jgi:4-amino-4-deoxy-L-arabinose transferase-like glycosyltransferase
VKVRRSKRGHGLAELPFFTAEQGRGQLLALLFFVSASVVTVWGTWQGALPPSDEAVIAETAREIVATGDAVTMHFDGAPVHDTPPLAPWLMSFFYRLFGVNEFAARFAFVLLSIATLYVLYHAGRIASLDWGAASPGRPPAADAERGPRTHWGTLSTAVGLFSAVILAASPLFGKFAPHVTLGIPFTFCTSAALLAWLQLPSRRVGLVLWCAAIAGCMLSSGAGAFLVIIGALLAGLVGTARRALWRTPGFIIATLIGVAIGGLWLFPDTARSGRGLLDNALWSPLARIIRPSALTPALMLDSFKNVWLRNLPWSVPATVAVARIIFIRGSRRCDSFVDDVDGALLVFMAVLFFPLSLGGAGTLSVFLPVLPFAAIISAREIARWLMRPGKDLTKRVWTVNHVMTALFCLLMLLVVTTPVTIRRTANDPIKDVAKMAARLTSERSRIGNFRQPYREQCARMLFYGGRSLEEARERPGEVAAALREDPRMVFLCSAQDIEALRAAEDFPFRIKLLYGAGDLVLFGVWEPGAQTNP